MLQFKNTTPFIAQMTIFPDESGIDTLYIIVKATFNIRENWTLVDVQPAINTEDIYWTEPVISSLRYANDVHPCKPATDIIMNGHAIAANGKAVSALDVNLTVANNTKTIRVFGDRVWQNQRITSPIPFQTMPLVYEKAYGGVHRVAGQVQSVEPRNPVGCGFAGSRPVREMENMPLPNLEDPAKLISHYQDQPQPASFGYSATGWQPRSAFAGTYDEHWQTTRAPYLPEDFDNRFFNMAHSDMIVDGYLRGGEPVHISHMHPHGELNFKLPMIKLVSNINVGDQLKHAHFNMETLLLEPNQRQLSLVWKAAMRCPKKILTLKEIKIGLTR